MSRQWHQVSLEQARSHPLYGVKNWLAVFAFGILFAGLRELVAVNGAAYKAGMTLQQLLTIDHPAIAFTKLALTLDVLSVAIIYWLLFTKNRNFRQVSSAVLFFGWPLAALFGALKPFDGFGNVLGLSLFPWLLSCGVWVTYLQRSRRVRITFEQCVPSDEVRSEVARTQSGPMPTTSVGEAPTNSQQSISAAAQPSSSSERSKPERTRESTAPRTSVSQATQSPDRAREIAKTAQPMQGVPSEQFWSVAIAEFEGPSRRPGLWARVFSEAQGNEAIAKANYLRYRAEELHDQHSVHLEQERRNAEAAQRAAALAHLTEEQRAYAELPKGVCPRCEAIISLSADPCPECGAMFGPGSSWKPRPIDEKGQVEVCRAAYLSGKRPTVDEVIFLAGASSRDKSLATLSDRSRAETLLHWAAKFGLSHEALLLIANGANAASPNGSGQKPFVLAEDLELRGVLRAAAHPTET